VIEHYWLGASWAFLVSVGAATCISLSGVPPGGPGAGAIPQSPELGDLVGLHPFYPNGLKLSCTGNQRTTVPERIISFDRSPKSIPIVTFLPAAWLLILAVLIFFTAGLLFRA
jgi:hypothetical protein